MFKKDPARRFQDAGDLKVALAELKEESESGALEQPAARADRRKRGLGLLLGGAAIGLCIVGAAGWLYMRSVPKPAPVPKVVPMTSYVGSEIHPTFSPDGSQVAFSWNGEKQDNYDIVRLVDGGPPLRLTTDAAGDFVPAWSPDGRWIAFIRNDAVYLISPLGGKERKIRVDGAVDSLAWMPDSQSLLMAVQRDEKGPSADPWNVAIFQVALGTGEMRRVTSPPRNAGDFAPAVSPGGQRMVFTREDDLGRLCLSRVSGGEVRCITQDRHHILGAVWVNDQDIVFSSDRNGAPALWRLRADGASEPQPVPQRGEATNPALARPANRECAWHINWPKSTSISGA